MKKIVMGDVFSALREDMKLIEGIKANSIVEVDDDLRLLFGTLARGLYARLQSYQQVWKVDDMLSCLSLESVNSLLISCEEDNKCVAEIQKNQLLYREMGRVFLLREKFNKLVADIQARKTIFEDLWWKKFPQNYEQFTLLPCETALNFLHLLSVSSVRLGKKADVILTVFCDFWRAAHRDLRFERAFLRLFRTEVFQNGLWYCANYAHIEDNLFWVAQRAYEQYLLGRRELYDILIVWQEYFKAKKQGMLSENLAAQIKCGLMPDM